MEEKATALSFTDILRRQITPAIEMLRDAIDQCSEDMWKQSSANAPIWEQVYHATFWLNAWARDWSTPFEKPAFHSDQALELESGASPVITREQMQDYLNKAKRECMSFIDGLTDDTLLIKQEGRDYTPADRIIGQIRHVQHHVGMIHAQIKEATGKYPKWT